MPKPRNEPAGESECPIKGCTERVPVFTYRASSSSDEKRRRFAGRLYCVCSKHGRVENQEFLLEHITWDRSPPKAAAAASPPSSSSNATSSTRDTTRAAPVRAPAKSPVRRSAPAPVTTQEKPKQSSGGGWLPDFFK